MADFIATRYLALQLAFLIDGNGSIESVSWQHYHTQVYAWLLIRSARENTVSHHNWNAVARSRATDVSDQFDARFEVKRRGSQADVITRYCICSGKLSDC